MVKPGGTGRPRFAISASPAPLPPRMSRIAAEPSARPGPKKYTQRARDGTSDHTVRAACRGAAWRARSRSSEISVGDSPEDRKSTRLNSSHLVISYAVFFLKKKKK